MAAADVPETRWDRPSFLSKAPKTNRISLQGVLKSLRQYMGRYIQDDLYVRLLECEYRWLVLSPLREFREIISFAFIASQEFTNSKNRKEYKAFFGLILPCFQLHGSPELLKLGICLPSLTCMMSGDSSNAGEEMGGCIYSLIMKKETELLEGSQDLSGNRINEQGWD